MGHAEFEAIYREHFQDLCAFAQSYIDAEAACDVVQDVLFDLWERRDTIDVRQSLRGYLFGAVRNRSLNVIRHGQSHQRMSELAGEDIPAFGEAPIDPAMLSEYSDLASALQDVLGKLPERQRAVLDLRWNHGLSYEQVSVALGISVQAAKMQVSRTQMVVKPLLERFRPR